MTEPPRTPGPQGRRWSLFALIIALAVIAAVAMFARPRPRPIRRAAPVKPTEGTTVKLPSYTILRTPEPIKVDGVLDEPVWHRLQPVGAFMLHDGSAAADFETEAKLCWDDKHLYVAFSCVDNDIWGTYTKRDDPTYEQEVVEIFINPSADLVNYFELEVSPRNVIWDGKVHNPDNDPKTAKYDPGWNCDGLLTGVRVVGTLDDRSDLDQLWSVEMAIPFASIVEQPPANGEEWRGNLYRIDRGEKDEYYCWSPTQRPGQPPAFHLPSRFGRLVFSTQKA